MTGFTPAVAEAVDAVRNQFAGLTVDAVADGAGGAMVTIEGIDIGSAYTPSVTWLGFHISSAYPDADIYPHFIGPVRRSNGTEHGQAIQNATWRDRAALQISRRSNHRDPAVDNAALKAERIMLWLTTQ
ncbi:hypothetical protein BX265_7027 [Streptomyces sp. TLI_235]|nr:hypothetical protein [Streptomyces sp. TLI_235]PBC69686.1 hypothetical protein BX265_7027 [Streptomyces sp. TLI_235]